MFLSVPSVVKTDVRAPTPGDVRACIGHQPRTGMLPASRCAVRLILALNLLLIPLAAAAQNNDWYLTVYSARGTDSGIEDVPQLRGNFVDSYFLALAPAKRFATFKGRLEFEVEGQVVKHFKKQDHWEFNAAVIARWLTFPWDRHVDTSLAVGEGISYATQIPEIEAQRSKENSHLLNYIMIELAFKLPGESRWSAVARVHHRSGVYGLFNGVSKGSNFIGAGLKYEF